jgi:hypothetical protein
VHINDPTGRTLPIDHTIEQKRTSILTPQPGNSSLKMLHTAYCFK